MIWKDIVLEQPSDGASVWIRRLFNEDPVQATYDATAQEFTTVDGLVVPAPIVSRWRLV